MCNYVNGVKILKKRQLVFKSHRNKIFLIAISLATLLLGIGYAQLTHQTLFINADADVEPIEDVIITSVTSSNISIPAYTSNSVNSTVTLDPSNPSYTASMMITVYNNSDVNQYFLGTTVDSGIGYTNPGIVYTISGIDEEELIEPGESKTFTVTFSYKDGQLQSSNTLTSFIQYNFSPLDSMTFTANNSPSATYTGAALTPSGVTVSTPSSGVEIKYGTTEGTYDSSSVPTFTEVGTYTVYYQLKAEGYLTERGSYTFTIEKATPVITLSTNTGTVVEGYTMTFTATVRSGATNGNVAGTLSVSSGTTTVATVSPASSNITATPSGLPTTITVTGVTNGTSTITVGFTPGDTSNYNTPTSVTYTANIVKSATIPTNTLCVNRTYTGIGQNLTSVTSGTGYTLSNYNQTNAGEYTIIATLVSGYAWSDNTTGTKTFSCTMSKATPVITLSAANGVVMKGYTESFVATVSSGSPSVTATGTLSVTSSDTDYATVSPTSSNITANTSGIATTETVTGVEVGTASITVSFVPTDTTNFNNAVNKTYTVTIQPANMCIDGDYLNNCLIYNDSYTRNYNTATTTIQNKSARDFSTTATTDEGLHAIADYSSVSSTTLDGTSYYYRGAVEDNWVSFAGYYWRIVRINGDGSVRLIYSGTTSNHTGADAQIGTSAYNSSQNDAKYVGYTYDNSGTETDSTIKGVIDSWYATNIKPSYEGYISNEIFCNDRSVDSISGNTYYGAYARITANKAPSLLCTNQSDRYTLKISGQSSIAGTSGAGNNLLEYPVGLLTVDETSLAGGLSGISNSSYYLYTGQSYRLGSPILSNDGDAYLYYAHSTGMINYTRGTNTFGVRPVLNLKPSVKYASGSGTESDPYIIKQEPSVELSSSKGNVAPSDSTTFTTIVKSGGTPSIPGTLTVSSSDTSKATVSSSSSNITATLAGTSATITVTGVALGSSTITVTFTPTDTSYNVVSKTYIIILKNSNDYAVTFDANTGAFVNGNTTNTLVYPFNYLTTTTGTITKYSHTSNVDDTGLKTSNYGNSWTNANITGTDRGDTSKAHVVTIPGASSLTVDIYYNGESVTYDWVTVWAGSHPDYTAYSNYSSGVSGGTKLGGSQSGSYVVNGNSLTRMGHSTFTISGDTVTFGFRSDGVGSGQGYGYYAIITGQGTIEVAQYTGTYEEPTKSEYDFLGWLSSEDGNIYNNITGESLRPDGDVTYIAQWGHYVAIPTAANYCKTGLSYTGSSQTITNTPATGYSFSNNEQINAGTHTVTATLDTDYVWSDDTRGTKTFDCSVGKITPVITLSETSGTTLAGNTTTFTATVTSTANSVGILSVSSDTTSIATVSPASSSVTATSVGVATTETITGVSKGTSNITVAFTPSDTTNFNNASSKIYSVFVAGVNQCVSGDTLANCLVYNDYGSRNYSGAITNINNKAASNFSSTSTTYEGLKAIADYSSVSSTTLDGTSYYYRGAIGDNWVSFAGYLWRVVRINGDGSVRMIYSGDVSNHTGIGTQIGLSYYNHSTYNIGEELVGYTYGTNLNSLIKTEIDNWYEASIKSSYEGFLSDGIFCNDKSVVNISNNFTYYGAFARLYSNKTPSLECVNSLDRYTLKSSGQSSVVGTQSSIVGTSGAGNNLLIYPVGLLTADEASLAGGVYGSSYTNRSFYLYTGQNYWLGSPWGAYSQNVDLDKYIFNITSDGYLTQNTVYIDKGIRPVLNLKSTVKYVSGSGTEIDPYILKQEQNIVLSSTEGYVSPAYTRSFVATISSGGATSIAGVLTVSSSDTTKATVAPASSNVIATQAGVGTTITITGVSAGSSTITVTFTPTDTSYSAVSKTYTITVNASVPTLAEKLIMVDQGASSYSDSLKTAIQNKSARDFSIIAETDEGLHAIEDYSSVGSTTLDGTSYYYRGDIGNNWVSFAGFLWRIVRINGDGSVRMIYSGTPSNHTDTLIDNCSYNSVMNGHKYAGYTYDDNGSEIDSTIKTVIDNWYEINIKPNYESYLSNEIFCNDRSLGSGANSSTTYYGAYTRLLTNKTPTLECANVSDRYTLKVSGQSGIVGINGAGNNMLDYPVGLLTADEASLAGHVASKDSEKTYLTHVGHKSFWFGTPQYSSNTSVYALLLSSNGNIYGRQVDGSWGNYGVRPVLNLKPSIKYDSGNGTESSPYTVSL